MTYPSEQGRELARRMVACNTIEQDTRTQRPDGAIPALIAILIGAYFVIRALI